MSGKKVFVAVPCAEMSRYSEFWRALQSVQLPPGSVMEQCRSPYIANNQNILARLFLKSDCDYYWLTNDDQLYMPSTLMRLLAHDKDVIVPICLGHDLPCEPLIYDRTGEVPDSYHHRYLKKDDRLVRIIGSGGGGMLISRRVMEAIPDPWWETHTAFPPGGDPMQSTEDLDFCAKAVEAGFEIWCDTDNPVGHITPFVVWPVRQADGTWATVLSRGDKQVALPAASDPVEAEVLIAVS